MVRIEINGVFLDLFEDTSIKLNKKFTYFGDDDSSVGSFSYDFEIPLTKTNQDAIEYDGGHFNPDGMSCLYYYTEKDYIKATFIVNSVDIFNKTASVCLLDDISYLSNISDSVRFQDLIDEEYTIGTATNEDNFWNIRYVDTLGTNDTDGDIKTVLLGCNDNKGVLPFTVNPSRLCDAINSYLGTSISIPEDNIEAVIPVKDFICRDFEDEQVFTYTASGRIIGAASLDLYADSMSGKTNWLELTRDYDSLEFRTSSISNYGIFNNYYVKDTTYSAFSLFSYKTLKGNKKTKFSIESYSVGDIHIRINIFDGSITAVNQTYPVSDFTGGDVALVLDLGGKEIVLKKGVVNTDGSTDWNDAFSSKNIFNEAIELEAGEEYIPKLKLLSLSDITFKAYNKAKGSLIEYTWVGDTITGGDSNTEFLPVIMTINDVAFSIETKIIGYDDNIKYSPCGGSLAYFNSEGQKIDIGCTLDTSGIKPIDLIKRYIKRFNCSLESSSGDYNIIPNSSSYSTIHTSKADFDDVKASNVSALESIRSFQLINDNGDTAYDKYSDETILGSSDKMSISDTGVKDKQLKLDSSILPVEFTDGIKSIDESDAKVVSQYGAYYSGVFPSERIEMSKYGTRFGFLSDSVYVSRLIQTYSADVMRYSFVDNVIIDKVAKSKYSDSVKTVSIALSLPSSSSTASTKTGYLYKGFVYFNCGYLPMDYRITSIDGVSFSMGYLPYVYNALSTTAGFCKSSRKKIDDSQCVEMHYIVVFPFIDDGELISSFVKIGSSGFDTSYTGASTLKSLSNTSYIDGNTVHLAFNSRESGEYVNALEYYFNPVKSYIYNANAIILEGEVTLNRDDLATLYKSNTIIQIDGENWIPIQVENIDLSEKASKVKVKLCKEL